MKELETECKLVPKKEKLVSSLLVQSLSRYSSLFTEIEEGIYRVKEIETEYKLDPWEVKVGFLPLGSILVKIVSVH